MFQLHNNSLPNTFSTCFEKSSSVHNYKTRQVEKAVYFLPDLLHLIESTFDRKRIYANLNFYPNPNANSNLNTNPNRLKVETG